MYSPKGNKMPELTDLDSTQIEGIKGKALKMISKSIDKSPVTAIGLAKQLLRCDSENVKALGLLGLALHRINSNIESIEVLQTAIEKDPDNADNYNSIGLAYQEIESIDKAISNINKALELSPEKHLFKNNLAIVRRKNWEFEKAIELFNEILEERPDLYQIWTSLGGTYTDVGKLDKAYECFEKALELDPDYSTCHVEYALVCFLQKHWEKGFKHLEWRKNHFPQLLNYKQIYDMSKEWNGKDSLEGKRILVYAEQGMGDSIHFMRYLPRLKERGAYVIVHLQKGLNNLFLRHPFIDEVINFDIDHSKEYVLPEHDYQCATMSLPKLFNDYEICGEPYIEPTTDKFKDYIDNLYGDNFKIGIAWAGNPLHPQDKGRSIPLKYFRPIHDTEGVTLFSLQFYSTLNKDGYITSTRKLGPAQELAEGCEDMKIIDLTKMIQCFEDTSTVLAGLDLVICCDTSVAHLAGAMGVPVWVALFAQNDWRWTMEGKTTPWYNSMRLFRQTYPGDWDTPFQEMKKDLDEVLLQRN